MKENENEKLYAIRHAMAQVMACAVKELFPGAKLGNGPVVEGDFYYDFDLPRAIVPEDLEKIEVRMREILKSGIRMSVERVSPEEAQARLEKEPYKLELLEDWVQNPGCQQVALIHSGGYVDLDGGSPVPAAEELNPKAFKLMRFSGAYWKGDAANAMLQRIYGTAWEKPEQLKAYLDRMEEAARRDHRLLGSQLDYFSSSPEIGQGLVLWHPKGAMVRYLLEKFSQTAHILNGYDWVYTPHIGRAGLWETSGHLQFYKDSMYNAIEIDNEAYYLKPMSCPFHVMIYNSTPKSYRDLPVRYAEYATVYRYELSGALQGLTRVRGFTQDDAHIICMPDQIQQEVLRALKFSLYILSSFGLREFKAYIATRPQKKAIGDQQDWDRAIEFLKAAVKEAGLDYEIDEGGGAFYGPKIDLKLKDALDREWQCSTIQFDFNLPQRFNMAYTGSDGALHTPMMVHRALFGSLERFFAMLIEHYGGEFPLWYAPVQIGIVPVSMVHGEYCRSLEKQFKSRGLRVSVGLEEEKMRANIRRMELQKIPIILVVGDREVQQGGVSVRMRKEGNLGFLTVEEFLKHIKPELDKGIPQYLGE